MPGFTLANLKEVEASTSAPPGLEARVAREQLGSEHLGVSYFHYAPGVRPGVMRAVEGGPEGLGLIAIDSDRDENEEMRADEGFWAD
jgi:hypothetical protein